MVKVDWNTSIQYLKGVGEKRAQLYKKLGILTVGDLIYHFPRSYIDPTQPCPIAQAPLEEAVTIRARVIKKSGEQRIRKGMSLFKVTVCDDQSTMVITFFNGKYTVDALQLDQEYLFYGKVGGNLLRREMSSPMVIPLTQGEHLIPIYSLTAGLTSRAVANTVRQALDQVLEQTPDPLPAPLRQQLNLCHIQYALQTIHHPTDFQGVALARRRLIFEELFILSLALCQIRQRKESVSISPLPTCDMDSFYQSLPFFPTQDQQTAIEQILSDLSSGRPMNRLVQGDVGCGKTLVAAAAAYAAFQGGRQAAMMAPTEILAEQHADTLTKFLEPLGVRVGLLTGSMKVKEKNQVKTGLASGEIHLAVGTHALISQGIAFQNLALVITDEQHRFGVNQRTALAQKGEETHTLVMSATPIPRTLALMIYGDLDLSVIRQMPKGRLPIKTYQIDSGKRQRAFGFIRDHLDQGLQAYIVCPLVEQGEADLGLIPATEYVEQIQKSDFRGYRVGLLHGKMKAAEKEQVMSAFQRGEIQLLVSTTVVEVGVDVPNAVIMLIENAERFGLSQLHQLRGRVGRGSQQSYCILVSDSKGEDAKRRLQTLCRTNSGFEIAEQDLALRGPGDFFGARQHGLPQLQIADMANDLELLQLAQEKARLLLDEDPFLDSGEHVELGRRVDRMLASIGERPN